MPIPLLEGERGAVPFIVDRSTPFVTESRNGVTFTRIPGRFSICDSVNGNNRRYPKKVWEKNLADGSTLKESIKKNAAFGLLEHPSDGKISLLSPICILVTDAKLQAGDDGTGKQVSEVVGEIIVIKGVAEGQKLQGLIEVGYNPLVSSRGFGSVLKASDGIDEVQDDYVCEGWDVVLRPSFEKAELFVPRDGKQEEAKTPVSENALSESKGYNMWRVYQHFATLEHQKSFALLPDYQQEAIVQKVSSLTRDEREAIDASFDLAKLENLKAASSPSKEAAPAADKPKLTETVMTINEIKSRIGQVKGTPVPKDPARFAEGMNEMAQLHQEVANFVAEDAKRSWQGQQVHDELSRIERTWSESALAPSKAATKLNEHYTKVLKVTKVLGEAAVNIRKKLSEALSQNAEAAQLIEELTERGQAWVAVADKRKAVVAELEHKLEVACEALDIIRDRYNEDMTDMGRRVITLEFAEKAQSEPIQKALKEAKSPKDIITIREQITGKPAEGKKDESKKDEGKVDESKKDDSKAPKNESKETPAPAPKQEDKKDGAPAADAQPQFEGRVLVPSVHSVTESVAMVQRLSQSRLTEAERREQEKAAK